MSAIPGTLTLRQAGHSETLQKTTNPILGQNSHVIRRMLALGLALAVQGGAVCAPFLHAHVDADHDDHHSTSVHAHFSSHAPAHVAA